MGVRFQQKASAAVDASAYAAAAVAAQEGRSVCCPVLPKASGLASGVDTWAVSIEAIERAGWKLDSWAIDPAGNGRPVFRRVA